MRAAIRKGDAQDEWDWEPVSKVVEVLALTHVATEEQIEALDPMLLEMLRSHEYFLDEIAEDPAMAIGGGVYDAEERDGMGSNRRKYGR